MTMNDDRSHRSSSSCHVAVGDVATGLKLCWGLWVSLELVWGLWVSLELMLGVVGVVEWELWTGLAPSFHFRKDSGWRVT